MRRSIVPVYSWGRRGIWRNAAECRPLFSLFFPLEISDLGCCPTKRPAPGRVGHLLYPDIAWISQVTGESAVPARHCVMTGEKCREWSSSALDGYTGYIIGWFGAVRVRPTSGKSQLLGASDL